MTEIAGQVFEWKTWDLEDREKNSAINREINSMPDHHKDQKNISLHSYD